MPGIEIQTWVETSFQRGCSHVVPVDMDSCAGIIASHWVNMTCFLGKSSLLASKAACRKALSEALLNHTHVRPFMLASAEGKLG